jgi:general secretion pathway protein K
MVRQQSRAVQVESAERARTQAAWILSGALDWARLILREDARAGSSDHLREPWAFPLAEARLSTFLAADASNNADLDLDVFLSGRIVDAQSRYNLRNLVDDDGKIVPLELRALQRLCDAAGLPTDVAGRIAQGLSAALDGERDPAAAEAPLLPQRVAQLAWLGVDPAALERLAPFVELLPVRTPINANTASREVLAAVIDGLDLGSAERLVQARERSPFASLADLRQQLGEGIPLAEARVTVRSGHFDVIGRVRLGDHVLEERWLVQRSGDRGAEVVALRRERRSLLSAASP